MRWQPQPLVTQVYEEALRWVIEQFENLSGVLEGADFEQLSLKELHAAPAKPRDGMVVFADGTDWNPDATNGQGMYVYYGSAWHYLG